jgi:hypothetical protein
MNTFDLLANTANEQRLQYLMIGGHAINAYGYSRITVDLDILIDRETRDKWSVALTAAGYQQFHDGGTFLQFSPPSAGWWPLDLMLVAQATFDAMFQQSRVLENNQPNREYLPSNI